MRDVLIVVTVVGLLGIAFILALAAAKYGEAIRADIERKKRTADRTREESAHQK